MSATPATIAAEEKPFGLDRRVEWTASRVIGSPEPPLPYTVEAVLTNVPLKSPLYASAEPGTPNLLHRIGGIEKQVDTGHLDYSPANHQAMTDLRKGKVDGIADHIPEQDVELGTAGGKLVIVGWGSTYGPIHQAVTKARRKGLDVSHVHIRYIWPMPRNLGPLLHSFGKVIVPEMNTGQLKTVLRDQFLVDAKPLNKVSGQPFRIAEIEAAIEEAMG